MTRVVRKGGLPAGLTADRDAYDAWFRAKVREALKEERPPVPHAEVMAEMREPIDRKDRA